MTGTAYYEREKVNYVILNRDSIIDRIENCMDNNFYVEAIIIIHSLIENYTYRVLQELNIPYKSGDKVFHCMNYLRWQLGDGNDKDVSFLPENLVVLQEDVKSHLYENLIASMLFARISKWRLDRNILVHDIAIEDRNDEKTSKLAKEGLELFLEYENGTKILFS